MSRLEEFTGEVSRFGSRECSIPGAFIHLAEGAGRMQRHTKTVILALCAVLWAAASLWAVDTPGKAAGKPKATVVEPVKDVGSVPKGQKIIHDFVIKNDGDADLTITNVQPACGCTVAEFDKLIKPGATGKVHAVVDTAAFGGPI